MLGYADQASETARQSLDEATDLGSPLTIAYALAWNVFLYLQTGDWPTAEKLLDRLRSYAAKDDLSIFYPQAVGYQGILAVLRDDPSRGIELLQTALAARAFGQELYRSMFSGPLAQAFAQAGRIELARTTISEAVTWAENHGRSADLPELLRIKADILSALSPTDTAEVEACLESSLQLARLQSALSLELRSGMSLARLWAANGKVDEAQSLLASIHSRFTEGFHTSDLIGAASLLDELRSHN
jgi:hypothetical protein